MGPCLPSQETYTGKPRSYLSKLVNGILYVLMTVCTWKDIPRHYGSKSTVHRFHLYLCEHDLSEDFQ